MNAEPNSNPKPAGAIDAAERLTPDNLAVASGSESFVHGLLIFRHHDTRESQEARIRRVLNAIDDSALAITDAHAPAIRTSPLPRGRRLRTPARRNSIPVALVALFLAGAAALLAQPMQSSAQATVQSALNAARAPGDHRYEVRILSPNDSAPPEQPTAIVETRQPNLLLIRTFTPDGRVFIAGRDAAGEWVIGPDGAIDRDNARARWPRWAMVDDSPVFAESVESLLEMLSNQFVVRQDRPRPLPAKSRAAANIAGNASAEPRPTFEHLIGERRVFGPGPRQFMLWLTPESMQVERIELRFPQNIGPAPEGRPGPGPGPGAGPGAEGGPRPPGRPPRGERPDRPRPDLDSQDQQHTPRPRPRLEHPDGPRGPINRPGPDRPRGPERDRENQLGPDGPLGPNAERDPDRPRRPGMRPPHARGGFGPPHPGPPGLRPDGPRPDGPRPDGPDGPGMEGRPPPPKAIIIERVDADGITNDWFSPDTHIREATTQRDAAIKPPPPNTR